MNLNPRQLRLVKRVGYPVLGLFVFVVSFYATFPYQRIKNLAEHQLSTPELEVEIGELGASPLLGVSAKDVVLRILPPANRPLAVASMGGQPQIAEKSKPQVIQIDEVDVSVGLLSLMLGSIDVDFDVDGLGGSISGSYAADSEDGWSLELEAKELELSRVPQLQSLGPPMRGRVSAAIELDVPQNRMADAAGAISFDCPDCSYGDGKSALKLPAQSLSSMPPAFRAMFASEGITIPRIRLGPVGGELPVDKGVVRLDQLAARGDLQVHMEGTVRLRRRIEFSVIDAYLRFKVGSDLKKRDAKFELVETALGDAKRADGFLGLSITGVLGRPRVIPSKRSRVRHAQAPLPPNAASRGG